jgi:ABC-type Na+ transport system ATPase subunit NatA
MKEKKYICRKKRMDTTKMNESVIEGYIGLLDSLSTQSKLELIARLTALIQIDLKAKPSSFKKAFGAWQSEETAEEIIDEVRNSRVFNRAIEML